MKKIMIGLVALSSISASAQSTLERTAKVISAYTPISTEIILSREDSLNRPILNNYFKQCNH